MFISDWWCCHFNIRVARKLRKEFSVSEQATGKVSQKK